MIVLTNLQNNIVITILLFIVGLVLIVKGGDFFVDASSWIAEKSGIPKFIIGATIVSFATTMPELLVSIFAAIDGNSLLKSGEVALANAQVDMAIGNAIGSVIANTGLIMAISICFMPSIIKRKDFVFKPALLVFTIITLFIFNLDGKLAVLEGIFVLIICVAFLLENAYTAKLSLNQKEDSEKEEPKEQVKHEVLKNILKFVFGVAGIIIGAQLLVDQGTAIATLLNVPTKIIAITIVAIGTSLPELVTTITAIVKKQSSLSIGNIIGANIIDLTLILPVCAMVYGNGLPASNQVIFIDIPFALLLTLVAVVPTIVRKKFSKVQGYSMLMIYIAYLVLASTIKF